MKNYWSIDRLLKNVNILQVGTGKNGTIFYKKKLKITKQEHAFKGFESTYNVNILSSFNPELQLKDTESAIKSKLTELLTQLKGVETLFLVLEKIESQYKTKYGDFYSSSKAKIIIKESNIDDVFQSIYTIIITNKQKSLVKGSG